MWGSNLTSATAETPGGETNSDVMPPATPTMMKTVMRTARARRNWYALNTLRTTSASDGSGSGAAATPVYWGEMRGMRAGTREEDAAAAMGIRGECVRDLDCRVRRAIEQEHQVADGLPG